MKEKQEDILSNSMFHRPLQFEEIYYKFYKPLFFYVNSIINDEIESKDLVSEAFIKYHARQSKFQDLKQIKSFLFTTIRNLALNILRHRKVILTHDNEIVDAVQNHNKSTHFFDKLVLAEFIAMVQEEVEKLPLRQKEVFKLTYFEDLSAEEIAETLGIQIEAVYNNKKRAIDKLHVVFQDRNLLFYLLLANFLM